MEWKEEWKEEGKEGEEMNGEHYLSRKADGYRGSWRTCENSLRMKMNGFDVENRRRKPNEHGYKDCEEQTLNEPPSDEG